MQVNFGAYMMAGARKSPETLYAMQLWREQRSPLSIAEAAKRAGIHPTTLYRALFPNGNGSCAKRLAIRK